ETGVVKSVLAALTVFVLIGLALVTLGLLRRRKHALMLNSDYEDAEHENVHTDFTAMSQDVSQQHEQGNNPTDRIGQPGEGDYAEVGGLRSGPRTERQNRNRQHLQQQHHQNRQQQQLHPVGDPMPCGSSVVFFPAIGGRQVASDDTYVDAADVRKRKAAARQSEKRKEAGAESVEEDPEDEAPRPSPRQTNADGLTYGQLDFSGHRASNVIIRMLPKTDYAQIQLEPPPRPPKPQDASKKRTSE
ncbi:hypothetical protein BaRGS_00039588, partial [Batillaria attramentaria]